MKNNITIILILLLTIVSSSIPAAASSKAKSDKKEAAKHEKIMEAMKILQTGQFRIKYYIETADRANYNMTRPASIYYRYDTTDPEYVSTNRSLDTINGTYTVRLVRKNGDATNVELNLSSGYLKFIFPGSFKPFHNNRGVNMLDYTSILPLYDLENSDYTKPRIQRKIVDSDDLLLSDSIPATASSKIKSDKKEAAKHEKIMEAMKILQTGQFRIKYYFESSDHADFKTHSANGYYRYDIADPIYASLTKSVDTLKGVFSVGFVKKDGSVTNVELDLNSGYLKVGLLAYYESTRRKREMYMYNYASVLPLYDTENADYIKPRIQRKIVDSYNLLQSGSFMISMPLAGLALADGLGLVVDPRDGRAELVSSAYDTAANLYTARYITDRAAGTSAQLRYNYRDGSLEVDIYEGDEPIITQSGSYKHIVAVPKQSRL